MRWLNGVTDSMDMNLSRIQEIGEDRGAWCAPVPGVTKSWTEQQQEVRSSAPWLEPGGGVGNFMSWENLQRKLRVGTGDLANTGA